MRYFIETPQLTSRYGSSAILSFRRLVSTAIGATAFVSVRDLVPSKVCFGLFESALNIDTQAWVTPWSTEKKLATEVSPTT